MGFRHWLRPGSKPLPSRRGAAGNGGVSFIQLAGTVRHAFCRGRGHWSVRCWRYNRSERPVSNLNLAHAEVLQVQHRQVRQHRASIARFETRARTAASRDRRAKPRLPRLPMCARPPLTGRHEFKPSPKGQSVKRITLRNVFACCRRPRLFKRTPHTI